MALVHQVYFAPVLEWSECLQKWQSCFLSSLLRDQLRFSDDHKSNWMLPGFVILVTCEGLWNLWNKSSVQVICSHRFAIMGPDPFQSAFRTGFSSETALVVIIYDLWWSQDSDGIFVLLDLLMALDIIDQAILLSWLYGLRIGGTILQRLVTQCCGVVTACCIWCDHSMLHQGAKTLVYFMVPSTSP